MATFREEFQRYKFGLNHSTRKHFVTSPWLPLTWFVLYRGLVCVFCSALLFVATIIFGQGYSLAFTVWSFATVTFYFVSAFLLSVHELYRQWDTKSKVKNPQELEVKETCLQSERSAVVENEEQRTPEEETDDAPTQALPSMTTAHKVQWLLFNIAANNAVITTLGYWCLLFALSPQLELVQGIHGFFNISTHLLNSVLMLSEMFLSSVPVHLLHVIYAEIYALIYFLMTLVLWLVAKESIYYFLDFGNPGLAIGFIFSLLLVVQPLIQLFLYGLYRLRGKLECRFRTPGPLRQQARTADISENDCACV